MAHAPIEPDETIPPHMHGFDPLRKEDAVQLIQNFPPKMASLQLSAAESSYYFDAATLTALLQAQRNECTYDGFIVLFGLDEAANDQLVLLIHRVAVEETNCNAYDYEEVPQGVFIENPKTKEIELIEYAIKPVNVNGVAQLHRIDRNSLKYEKLLERFSEKFKDDNPERTYTIKAKNFIQQMPSRSAVSLKVHPLTVGYYIGWGVLDIIRKELNSKIGMKLFLGFGTYSLNISSYASIHLIAMAADNPNAKVDDYPLPMVWSTQDQTKPEVYILDHTTTPLLIAPMESLVVGTLGTSCTFAIRQEA